MFIPGSITKKEELLECDQKYVYPYTAKTDELTTEGDYNKPQTYNFYDLVRSLVFSFFFLVAKARKNLNK